MGDKIVEILLNQGITGAFAIILLLFWLRLYNDIKNIHESNTERYADLVKTNTEALIKVVVILDRMSDQVTKLRDDQSRGS